MCWKRLRTSAAAALGLLLGLAGGARAAPPASYSDPAGYPAAWPALLATRPYTSRGAIQPDLSGNPDASRNATPQTASDYSSGAANDQASFFYTGDGTVLFFRLRLDGPPIQLTGSGQPFGAVVWNVLLDTDGDGFKEFVVMLDGDSGGTSQPDDIAVIYDDAATQRFNIGAAALWRQDCAGTSDGVDGGAYADLDPASYVWDFGRTRVIQLNTSKPEGSQNSEYYVDIQVPLAAFDATGLGGPKLGPLTPFALGATTSNSNTDPTQKDLLYAGTFALGDVAIPSGDITNGNGQTSQSPAVLTVTATPCPSPVTLKTRVLDATTVAGGVTSDTLLSVTFESYLDANGDGAANDGSVWTLIGSGSRTATLGEFTLSWTTSALAEGRYLVRAVATDTEGNTTASTTQSPPVFAVFDNTCGLPAFAVSGVVYADANHDGERDAGEAGTGATAYVKLVPQATPGGPAVQVASADPASGAYTLGGVVAGAYTLVVDDSATLSDVTPTAPAGFIPVQPASLSRAVTVIATAVSGQDFGLFGGSRAAGVVFRDDGAGGGTANDGQRQAGEAGLPGARIRATDGAGATTYASAETDGAGAFDLWIPAPSGALRLVEDDPQAHVSTGAQVGTTGGTYTRATDVLELTNAAGTAYSGIAFGDVPASRLDTDGARSALPGTAAFYPHAFVAGTAGTVAFSAASVASPAIPGWGAVVYRDTNCNGAVDAGEPALAASVAVAAGERICLIVKEMVPPGAPFGAQDQLTLAAAFTFTGASPPLSTTLSRTDVTTVGTPEVSGLLLTKAVDKATALPGASIEYTIAYKNVSSGPLAGIVVHDFTPAYTTFLSATCTGPPPPGITGCAVTAAPSVGASGAIVWTLTGALDPGAAGSVKYTVKVD